MSASSTLANPSGLLPVVLSGYCHCGCGAKTNLRDGKPQRYRKGHQFHKNPNCSLSKKDRKRIYDRERYEANRDEVLARVARWQKANPAKVNELSLRGKKRRRFGRSPEDIEYEAILRSDPCAYCGGSAGEIDHIEPVAAGGACTWTNLTAACRSCNARKRTRSLLAFIDVA